MRNCIPRAEAPQSSRPAGQVPGVPAGDPAATLSHSSSRGQTTASCSKSAHLSPLFKSPWQALWVTKHQLSSLPDQPLHFLRAHRARVMLMELNGQVSHLPRPSHFTQRKALPALPGCKATEPVPAHGPREGRDAPGALHPAEDKLRSQMQERQTPQLPYRRQ